MSTPSDPQNPVLIGEKRWAQITRVRHGQFVEFRFTVDSDDLQVELVMPWPELRTFCARNAIELLPVPPELADEVRALAFRHGDAEAIAFLDPNPGGPR